jgi:hypothetical protein
MTSYMQKNKLYCMVILNLLLPSLLSRLSAFSQVAKQTFQSFLAPSGPTEHSRSCSKPCSISNICAVSITPRRRGMTYPTVDPDFFACSPSGLDGLDRQRHSITVRHYSASPFTSSSLIKQDEMPTRKDERIRKKRRKRDGRTGETTRFPTPSLIFSLIKSLTSLPSGKVCRNRINGSKNCMRCESGGVESDSEGGGWA